MEFNPPHIIPIRDLKLIFVALKTGQDGVAVVFEQVFA